MKHITDFVHRMAVAILVTVGLCIIALLLCVVMKDSLETFIQTIVKAMTSEAEKILTGVTM